MTNHSRRMEWTLAEHGNRGRERPAFDPTSSGPAANSNLNRGPELMFGRVMDSVPYLNTYKVLPERGLSVITCGYAAPGPNGVIGARGISTLPVGALVWFVYHRDMNYGMILAVEPDFMVDSGRALSDFIYLGSRSGLHADAANAYPFQTNTRGLIDFSAGRPFDSTSGGEWGAITETGLRVILDSFMVQLGCGEACGVYAYLWDQLLRIAGVNLQIRSSFSELELLDDQSETYGLHGIATYPWEALGMPLPGQMAGRTLDAQTSEIDQPWYSGVEPLHDDQAPIYRSRTFSGYLGQGGKRLVSSPQVRTPRQFSNPGSDASLFEENISLTGRWSVRSAMGISLVKRPLFPSLTQSNRPEATSGDTTDNYRFSGLSGLGSGPAHAVEGSPALPDMPSNADAVRVRARGVEDLHAYVFNWESQLPFHYHEDDWNLTEESQSPLGNRLPPISFSTLSGHSSMYLSDPPTANVNIDHRYGSVKYALTNSYITMLDDGGVVIGDGFGAELTMSGGSIELSAPGDVWMKPGRNAVMWGGRDVIIRGNNHVDITASNKDVRIKAEKHLWALAGNGGGDGLLLLESRASNTTFDLGKDEAKLGEDVVAGGIVLRASNNAVTTWSKDIYLRTGGGSIAGGDIFLDANKGKNQIYTSSDSFISFLAESGVRYDAFLNVRTVSSLHSYGKEAVYLGGKVYTLGQLSVDGPIYANDWIYVDNGSIKTALSKDQDGLVQEIDAGSLADFFKQVKQQRNNAKTSTFQLWKTNFDQKWYQEKQAGEDGTLSKMTFSFRTGKQYQTYSGGMRFRIYEDRWQQMGRASGQASQVWRETNVQSQGQNTMPWPGYECFTQQGGLLQIDSTMFNMANGTSAPRGSANGTPTYYRDPAYGTPRPQVLNSQYLVTG